MRSLAMQAMCVHLLVNGCHCELYELFFKCTSFCDYEAVRLAMRATKSCAELPWL